MGDFAYLHDQVFLRGRQCVDHSAEIFFPPSGERYDVAATICGACPVQDRCEHYFLYDDSNGFIAGMTLEARQKKRKTLHKEAS